MQQDESVNRLAMRVKDQGPQSMTTREFLLYFGSERRGKNVVSNIRDWMEQQNIHTVPDFEGAFIDGTIRVEAVEEITATADLPSTIEDATIRIRVLSAANQRPDSVSPTDTIEKAVSLMLLKNVSQLPVMEGDFAVKGIVNWKSICSGLVLGWRCQKVSDCMEAVKDIQIDAPLLDAVRDISEHGYVLVKENNAVTGIVTASEVAAQFQKLAGPFLAIGEIERHLRSLVRQKFSLEEINSAIGKDIANVADMDFGDYCRLLENPDRWSQLHSAIDREIFIRPLNAVREIRNDVMHFDPEGLSVAQEATLNMFAKLLQNLSNMRAI